MRTAIGRRCGSATSIAPDEDNPVYGTAKVLAAFRDFGRLDCPAARRGLDWLASSVHDDGSFGGMCQPDLAASTQTDHVEQTALAVEALLSCGRSAEHQAAGRQGLKWLVDAVEANQHQQAAPIGFYFAKLWYYEKLYPLIWTVTALGQATRQLRQPSESPAVVHSGKI